MSCIHNLDTKFLAGNKNWGYVPANQREYILNSMSLQKAYGGCDSLKYGEWYSMYYNLALM